jgi:hypothetical protein
MNVKAEAMDPFRRAIYQLAYALTRHELSLSGILDSWR